MSQDNFDQPGENLSSFWHRLNLRQKILLIFGATLTFFGILLLVKSASQDETKAEIVEGVSTDVKKEENKRVFVDVSGAVLRPGVYSLAQEERIQSALAAAGGLAADADREWVAKSLNLAGKLTDGAKIYVPRTGETASNRSNLTNSANSSYSISLININTATAAQLDTLPGIGPATATKIITNRPYQSIEELVTKKAVSSKVFEGIKERISIY